MNLVKSITKQLDARRAELEQAEASLSQHQNLLGQAKAELSASNGDFDIWQKIDERVRFEQRQVERYVGIVEQCTANVECARAALENAQRETEVFTLNAACSVLAKNMGPTSLARIRALRDELRNEIAAIDLLQSEDEARCKRLQELGTHREPYNVTASWLHGELDINPGMCLTNVGGFFGGGVPTCSLANLLLVPTQLIPDGHGQTSRDQQLVMLTPSSERSDLPQEEAFVPPPYRTGTVKHRVDDADGHQHVLELEYWSDRTKRVPSELRDEARRMLSSPSEYMRAGGEAILALSDVI